ncbi:MAG: hypothetical protein RRY29_08160 [Desulfovibrionaceae bacterium]
MITRMLVLGVLWVMLSVPAAFAASIESSVPVGDASVHALDVIQQAIDIGDVALFEDHVDIDALVAAAVDYFLQDAQSPEGAARLSPVVAMIISSVGTSADAQKTLRGLMGREARNFVVYGVQSGHFAGEKRENVRPPEGLLAPLFADASLGRKEIRDKGAPRPASGAGGAGQDIFIAFSVYDYGNGRSYPVTGRMRLVNAHWKLVGVENLPVLVEQLRREAIE